jgi:cadmium resistance protein CadD (predicted permease)
MENQILVFFEIFISFFLVGFITWYGTGIDDLLFMSIIFKKKNHKEKVMMFFGNIFAVGVLVSVAAYLSHFSQYLEEYPMALRLPGLIPMAIGFSEIKSLAQKKMTGKDRKKKIHTKRGANLFIFSFFLYVFNSMDDFIVTSSIFIANNNALKITAYGFGFVFGSAISLFLASKFSRITQKISFLEFLAPVVIIAIGTLILSGFFI